MVTADRAADVVDEGVDPPESLQRGEHGRLRALLRGGIRDHRHAGARDRLGVLHHRVEIRPGTRRDYDVGALLGEAPGDGPADATAAAGDDCDLPLELTHGASSVSRFGMPTAGRTL